MTLYATFSVTFIFYIFVLTFSDPTNYVLSIEFLLHPNTCNRPLSSSFLFISIISMLFFSSFNLLISLCTLTLFFQSVFCYLVHIFQCFFLPYFTCYVTKWFKFFIFSTIITYISFFNPFFHLSQINIYRFLEVSKFFLIYRFSIFFSSFDFVNSPIFNILFSFIVACLKDLFYWFIIIISIFLYRLSLILITSHLIFLFYSSSLYPP